MAGRSVGAAFVDVGVRGIGGVMTALGRMKSALGSVAEKANELSTKAAIPFAALTAAVGKAASVASPATWDKMALSFDRLNLQAGRIFLPIIQDVTKAVNKLADWFKNLTDEQRRQIEGWVKLALGVGAVLVIVPKLVTAFTSLSALFGPIGIALAAVGAAFALLDEGDTKAIIDGISGAFSTLWEIVKPIFTSMWDLFGGFIDGLQSMWDMVEEAVPGIGDTFKSVFQGIGMAISKVVDAIKWIVDLIQKFVIVVATAAKAVSEWEFSGMGDKISANLDEFEKKKEGHKAQREATAQKMLDKVTGKGKENKPQPGRYAPEIMQQSAKVMGITDSYRSLQQAVQGNTDPKIALEQERLQESKAHTGILQQIADNTKPKAPLGQQ